MAPKAGMQTPGCGLLSLKNVINLKILCDMIVQLIPLDRFIMGLPIATTQNGVNFLMVRRYVEFLRLQITEDMVFGVNRYFVEEAIYHNVQPSSDYNYTTVGSVKIFQDSNTSINVSLGKTIGALVNEGLVLSKTGKQRI